MNRIEIKTIKMKNLTAHLFLMIIVFVSFSCNNNGDVRASKDIKKPEVRSEVNWVGHWLKEGQKENLVREIANEYEFLNQEIKINLKFPEDLYNTSGEGQVEFVLSQLKKEVPEWDIVRLYNHPRIGELLNDPNWMEKHLVNFKDVPGFMESHKEFLTTDIYNNRTKGFYYSPYIEGQMAALFVNVDVAKKIGIEVKQYGMTFNDFKDYIKAVDDYNQRNNANIIPCFEYNWQKTRTIFNVLFYSLFTNKEDILQEDLNQSKIDAIKKCLSSFEELAEYNVINKDWKNRDWTKYNNLIMKDSCLFFPNLTLMHGIWMTQDPNSLKKVIPCEFPVFQPSKVYIGGYVTNWVVFKNSPRKDEAVKLMMEFCKPEIAEKWVRYSKSPSGVKGNLSTSTFGIDPFEDYTFTIENKYELMLTDGDTKYIWGLENQHTEPLVQEVLTGELTAEQAFDDFAQKAELDGIN